MKQFFSCKHIRLTALMVFVMIISCSKVDIDSIENSYEENYDEVSVFLGGEYKNTSQIRIPSGGDGRYVGINVYAKNVNDNDSMYSPYAYGLFSDYNSITIKLKKNLDYRFECLIVEDHDDKIFVTSTENKLLKTGKYPFDCCIVGNEFIYDKQAGFEFSTPCVTVQREHKSRTISEELDIENADVEMFYGVLEVKHNRDSQTIEIPMFRIGYGLKIKVDGLGEGILKIYLSSNSHNDTDSESDYPESGIILANNTNFFRVFADGLFTIGEFRDWKERILRYEKDSEISFVLDYGDGRVEKFKHSVCFKRNKTAVLNMNPTIAVGIVFNMDDSDLEDDIENFTFTTKDWDEEINDVDI